MADIESLKRFSRLKERDTSLFFVGRDLYIDDIKMACADAVESLHQGECITSETRLFYGAPGAGKTSLLHELEKRAQRGDFGTSTPHVVSASHTDLNKEKELVLTIAQHLEMDGVFRTIAEEQAGMGANILNILNGSIQHTHTRHPPEATFGQLAALYRALKHQPPILLCVDEIQNIKPESDEMLSLLHQGNHGLPIIPVYAGLGNSLNMLMNHGVSRPVSGYMHSVGALAPDEAHECVQTMLTTFDVDCTDVEDDWPAILAECSDCWPQHLHNGMRALAQELIHPNINGRLSAVSLERVSTTERAFRNEAYSWRISEMISEHRTLVGHIMHQVMTSSPTREDVKQIIDDLHAHSAHSLPPEMTATGFLNHMIHRGLLQEFNPRDNPELSPAGVVTCPIPSLATYVMQFGGIDPDSPPVLAKTQRKGSQEDL
ncbi:MAG: ATP-binding protein [Aestuariivita sp.]|nr:ATP-binding protein [Aestuariivita sp.]